MPKPMTAGKPVERTLSEYSDYFYMSFGKPGEKHTPGKPIKAGAINTLGEVPDSQRYTARPQAYVDRRTRARSRQHDPDWLVTALKAAGVMSGLIIKDSKVRRYRIKLDTALNRELPSGADVMGSRFYYAFGYFTPENYIVYFNPERLVVESGITFLDHRGRKRELNQGGIERPPPRRRQLLQSRVSPSDRSASTACAATTITTSSPTSIAATSAASRCSTPGSITATANR